MRLDHLFFDDHDPLREIPLAGSHELNLGSYDPFSSGLTGIPDNSLTAMLNDPAHVESNQLIDQSQDLIHQIKGDPQYGEYAVPGSGQYHEALLHSCIHPLRERYRVQSNRG